MDAFVATDKTSALGSLIALKVHRRFPARAQALHALSTPVDGILNPIARGTGFTRNGEGALFLITPSPLAPQSAGQRGRGGSRAVGSGYAPRRPNSRQACCTRPDPSRDPPRECLCCSRGCHARLRLGRSTGHAPAIGVRNLPQVRCACQRAGVTAPLPMMCTPLGFFFSALLWAVCHFRVWTIGKSSGVNWNSAASTHSLRDFACRRRWPTWSEACWRKTLNIGRHPRF